MKQFKLFFACALMSLFSLGQVWADTPAAAGTTLFSEDFSSYAANAVPSGSVTTTTGRVVYGDANVTYSCTNGDGTKPGATKIYAEALATGTSPEILVGKYGTGGSTGGTFSIAGIPSGGAQEITVSFKQNKQKLKVEPSGTGYTGSVDAKPSDAGTVSFDIAVADGADATFTLTFSAYSSNVRVDDILVTVKTAGEGAGTPKTLTGVAVSGTPTKTVYNAGDNFDPAGLTVTGTYSDASTAPINSGITWGYNPSQTLALNQTSIGVTATVSEITSAEYNVTGLTVAAAPTVVSAIEDIEDGASYYIRGVRASGAVVEYLKFTDGTAGATISGTSASSTAEAIAITFNKVSDGVYQLVTPEGLYVQPGASNGKIALSTTETTCNLANTTKTWDSSDAIAISTVDGSSNTWIIQKNTSGTNFGGYKNTQYDVTLVLASAAATVAKPTISGDENFVGSTTVTITHADADAIYYTTNGVDPTTSSTEYTAPFVVNADGTTTVKAIAVKGSDVSEVASKGFTKVTALESLAALLEATVSAETAFNVVIDNWVVTGVNGTRAWISDAANEKGILLYKSGHNFVAGNKLNGVVIGTKSKLYQGYPELTSLVSTDVTVTTAETVTPRETTLAAIVSGYNAEQGTVVKLTNVTYIAGTGFSDGINTVALNTTLYTPTMVDGATYDIIGVVRYDNGPAYSIMPRKEADVEAKGAVVIPTAANLAALKAAARGTYILTLTNAVVTYVNGNNAFIEDATGGALIYFASHGYSAGDCLNGDYQVVTTDYQGKFEITAMEPQAGAATTTAAIPLTTLTITQLNADFAAYESRRIKIEGVNVTDALTTSDRNGQISDGVNTVALYAGVASTVAVDLNANIDIIGYPGFHNTDEQLTVWANEDITVNVKDPAGIAFTPESETITGGDPWSAPTFANPNTLDVEFSSDAEGVATVSNTGVVALAGGYGTAVITAHTNGDATHAAATVTYTITVNDPGATPVYTMSFDLTRASYDGATDDEVVWNSNVVTITAQKSSGTKVTNYLAGNYSGTTLIEETRLYENNNLVFTPQTGVTITKVEWTATSSGYAESLADYSAWTNATASVDGSKVVITPSATGEFSVVLGKKTSSTKGTRGTSVAVFYTAESEKAKLTASIAIDNMNMAVGDDDILLSAIAATSNPNKKAISYAVTSGTAVTIEGTGAEAALHAAAEGSATITATIPDDLGNYTGATTTFTITVAAAATLESIAIDGTATELEYTEGQSFNPAGLIVMGHYSNGSDVEITSGIDWTFAPDPLTEGTTSVSVTATVESINSPAFVVNGLTVSAAAPAGDDYIKVTALQTDWSGDYILVYEDGTDAYVWNGDYSDGASNYASATISSNTIAKPAAAAVITIAAASEGKYTLQVNGDKYFQDNGSKSKLIFTDAIEDAAKVTISYETDWTKLQFSERCIRFNSTADQTRFRFYDESNQQAVQLYKKDVVTPTPDYTRTEMLGAGVLGTICVDHNVTSAEGATFYEVSGLNGSQLVLAEVTGELEAGKPYVFQATGNVLNLYYGTTSVADPVNTGALKGTFSATTIENTDPNWANIYYFANHALYSCSDLTSLTLPANRAYLVMSQVGGFSPMPGRRYFTVNVNGKTTPTGMENLENGETPVKMIIDGQLFILRGEKLYDATGRLVK